MAGTDAQDQFEEGAILHLLVRNLHDTFPVTRAQGVKGLPNVPKIKLTQYLAVLRERHPFFAVVNSQDSGAPRDPRVLERTLNSFITKVDDIPQAYWNTQIRLARRDGIDVSSISEENKRQLAAVDLGNQRERLREWVNYFNDPTNENPTWFTYYVMTNVVRLSIADMNDENGIKKRSKGSMNNFPEVNPEIIAKIKDLVYEQLRKPKPSIPSFEKMYSNIFVEQRKRLIDTDFAQTDGMWKKYDQGSDPRVIVKDLAGWDTTWCTAGIETARIHLRGGDFYIYFTQDKDNNFTVPRVAIRMESGVVREVRGRGRSQELEEALTTITGDKLASLPGGEEYFLTVEHLNYLADLHNKNASGKELTKEELRFVYEIDEPIRTFGYTRHPYKLEILKGRNIRQDYATIFNCQKKDICVAFNGGDDYDNPIVIIDNVSFKDSQVTNLGQLTRISGNADFQDSQVTNLGQLTYIGGDAHFASCQFAGLGQLTHIDGNAYFEGSQITDLGQLTHIGRTAHFTNSQITSLGQLTHIDGNVHFGNSKITNLGNLTHIGKNADFRDSHVTSLGNLTTIGGDARFTLSDITDLGQLATIGGDAHFGDSQITDLGNLTTIGGDARFVHSNVNDLGNLTTIGGHADFRHSKIKTLGQLAHISENAIFGSTKIKTLGQLATIGGDAHFGHSEITDLAKLTTIGGNADFRNSKVTDLGNLATIGGDLYATQELINTLKSPDVVKGHLHITPEPVLAR